KDGIAVEPPAEPDDCRHSDVEHDLDFDRPQRAVHGAVPGIRREDTGDAGLEEVRKGEVGEQKFGDMEVSERKSDGQAEKRRQPIAGENSPGAVLEVLRHGAATLVAGKDQEAGDRSNAPTRQRRREPTARCQSYFVSSMKMFSPKSCLPKSFLRRTFLGFSEMSAILL